MHDFALKMKSYDDKLMKHFKDSRARIDCNVRVIELEENVMLYNTGLRGKNKRMDDYSSPYFSHTLITSNKQFKKESTEIAACITADVELLITDLNTDRFILTDDELKEIAI